MSAHVVTSKSLVSHNDLTVGDLVSVPGHGRNAPADKGTLVAIELLHFARGRGYFVKVNVNGRIVTTAAGLCRKVAS